MTTKHSLYKIRSKTQINSQTITAFRRLKEYITQKN